jgi:hypothetical protein
MSLEKTANTEELTLKNLEQVFILARLQMVNSRPNDKDGLIHLINFETQISEKIQKCKECNIEKE